ELRPRHRRLVPRTRGRLDTVHLDRGALAADPTPGRAGPARLPAVPAPSDAPQPRESSAPGRVDVGAQIRQVRGRVGEPARLRTEEGADPVAERSVIRVVGVVGGPSFFARRAERGYDATVQIVEAPQDVPGRGVEEPSDALVVHP